MQFVYLLALASAKKKGFETKMDYRRKIPPIWQSEKPRWPLNFSIRTFKYFDHIGYAMLTSRQYFFFKLPQINFNNKNNISECSQNAKKTLLCRCSQNAENISF